MPGSGSSAVLPVIDVGPLIGPAPAAARAAVAGQIQAACRERGFFYLTGHGVPPGLQDQLAEASAEFFALPLADKLEIAMERGGRAWRGFFPVGAELTSGRPDLKEGLYFGAELPGDDPRVRHRGRYLRAGPARARAGLARLLRAMSDSGYLAIDDPELAADQFVALLQPRRYYALLDPAASSHKLLVHLLVHQADPGGAAFQVTKRSAIRDFASASTACW